ncbi:MAG: transcription elongation factor GreB [Bdellovibrionota bacterium]
MKNYLTPEGYKRLREEMQRLLNVDRAETVRAVSDAAAMGDRSENAEYIYGKKKLREIDRRIRFLTKRLEDVEIVDPTKVDISKVSFGTWVKIVDEDGHEQSYQIVGEDEIDPSQGRITFSSPIGRALLGKKTGDVFEVHRPKGRVEIEIVSISIKR